jgi:hypothetical protein
MGFERLGYLKGSGVSHNYLFGSSEGGKYHQELASPLVNDPLFLNSAPRYLPISDSLQTERIARTDICPEIDK